MTTGYWNGLLTRQRRRRDVLGAAGGSALSLALLAACGGPQEGLKLDDASNARKPGTVWSARNDWKLADETKDAVKGGSYRGHMTAEHAGHYDAITIAASQVPSAAHVYESLMAQNKGPGVDPASKEASVAIPMLAESMEISNDGATVTFKMRPGVKWHPIAPVNGRVMDMDDWRTSQERFLATGEARLPMTDVLDKAEYPDSRTMVWKLKYPYAPMLQRVWSRFTYSVMPKELNANPSIAEKTAIGTGYKILDVHQPSVTMEYRKNPEYWGGDPFIDRWHAPIIPEYSNRYAQFVRGSITDFEPTARDVLLLSKDAPQTVIVASYLPDDNISRIRFGRQNHKTLPWKDVRVRIAIRRAINFKGIAEFLANKEQFESAGIPVEVAPRTHLARNLSYWLDPERGELGKLSDNYLFDATEARKLTAAAGFSGPIEIDYTTLPAAGEVIQAEQLVIDSMQQSGIFKVNVVRSLNTVSHRNCRSLGQCDGLVQSSTSEDADFIIYRDYHSEGNTEGEQAYPDPRIDRVAEAQRKEMDVEKRIALLKEFQMLAAELMPTVPYIHQYTEFRFRWPWLHNVNLAGDGSPPTGRPVLGGHKQWLDPAMPDRDRRS